MIITVYLSSMSGAFTYLVPSGKKQGLVHTDVLPAKCHGHLHEIIFWISVPFMMKLKYWLVYSALVDSLAL